MKLFRMRDVMANLCMTGGPYTHSSVTGKMAGASVIPDFLAHWHTSAKLCFQTWVQSVLFSLCLKACKLSQIDWSFQTLMCSGLALKACARSDAFSSCKWVPQLWVLLPLFMYYSTSMIPIEMSFKRCFRSDHRKSIVEQVWKTSANGISIAI